MTKRTLRLVRPQTFTGAVCRGRATSATIRLLRENALLRLAAGDAKPKALAAALLRLFDQLLPGCPCEVLIGGPQSNYLEVVGTRGFRSERGLGCRIPLGVGVTGAAASRARPIWVRDVAVDPRYIPGVAHARWELAIPLRTRHGVVGVIDLESPHPRGPGMRRRRYLAALAATVAPAFGRALAGGQGAALQLLPPRRRPVPAQGAPGELATLLVQRRLAALYQPVVELGSRRVIGYEAEVAGPKGGPWDTAERLLTAPRDAVLAAACDQARLQAALAGFPSGAGRLFLDIHHASLRRPGFGAALQALLREHGLGPTEVVLEIQGAGLHVESVRKATAGFPAESALALAMDRFGAGAADAQALVDLQPAYVKLDAALVRGVDRDFGRRTYVESLCYYTRRTRTRLIALGIATAEEIAALRRCGVAYGQGELVGPAAPLRA